MFQQVSERGTDCLLSFKTNQKSLRRQICDQRGGKYEITILPSHEISHGRDINWKLR